MAKTLDLSADIGEGYGVYPAPMQPWRAKMQRGGEIVPSVVDFPSPRRIMNLVTSVSLACGFYGATRCSSRNTSRWPRRRAAAWEHTRRSRTERASAIATCRSPVGSSKPSFSTSWALWLGS
jgi:hypothetical protein